VKGQEGFQHKLDQALVRYLSDPDRGDATAPVLVKVKQGGAVSRLGDLCAMCSDDHEGLNLLEQMNLLCGSLSDRTLQELASRDEVEMVYLDQKVRALLDIATQAVGSRDVVRTFGLTGKGVGIAVLDTGIHPHPDLIQPVNRIVAFRDLVQGRTEPYDDNGHGTHVAGCAAGNGFSSSGRYRGTAPEANLIGIKVLDAQGEGYFSTILEGINWCIENKARYNIRIINLSLGGEPASSYVNDPIAQAAARAWRAGIVVCAAAGNTGPTGTINTPGTHPHIITVGSLDDQSTPATSDDRLASYSSRGPTADGLIKPDLCVPGTNITSLLSPGSTLASENPGNIIGSAYLTLSGTSMATPLCAGACAQLLQAFPTYTPDQIKTILKSTGRYFAPNTPGYLDLGKALQMIRS